MSQEFPRMVYRGDEQLIVADSVDHAKSLKDGFVSYDEMINPSRKKPGPKPKPKAE